MKIIEVIKANLSIKTLDETDGFIFEMANFLSDVTDLPANIVLWTRPQPEELPHSKYRMKVFKDRVHVATFTIGATPTKVWQTFRKGLDTYEEQEVIKLLTKFSSLFIQYIDEKMPIEDVKYYIKKS